ncbi:MAG: FAD-dependent oxidoreductase [Verrucomicrobiota bacterium]|jgi:putative selenate reductase|nr:FAD-dependent oxidoreductase [Verrucomicrobiota bacterium]
MSDRFQPLSMTQLAAWVFGELDHRGSIFGIPKELFFRPKPTDPFRTALYSQPLETPFGVAAGPHSQMAQNIIAAWLQGSRFIELKTIQTLDELEITKPCIDMQDEGYNVEWSQELKIDQSVQEYVMAWVVIHALRRKLGFEGTPGMIFNMSVGYNLEGVLKPNVQRFLARMADAGDVLTSAVAAVAAVYPAVKEVEIPSRLSDNVTLSTMHGCPPDEIGKIAAYLIEDCGLHTNVKLNPTLLGPERLRSILNDVCGFRQVTVPDEAFGHDLKYADALNILTDLRVRAEQKGVQFGVKLSNTLEVLNHRTVFPAREKMMYLSGRPLQAVTVNLAAKLATEFAGELKMSYAGGADAWNVADLLACGMTTVTTSSDLLRPGGYARTLQYLSETRTAMAAMGAGDLPSFILAKADSKAKGDVKAAALANLTAYAEHVLASPLYKRDSFDRRATKTSRPLFFFDCVQAPCTTTCPIGQDVPAYMDAVKRGALDEAAAIVRRDNAMGATLGRACNHDCELTCIRTQYDQPLAIREIKRFIMEKGTDPVLEPGATQPGKVSIIGAGPCGLSAAAFLREAGLNVTVWDERSQAGGMAAKTLPAYRSLPAVVQQDVDRLKTAGVQFRFGQTAGRDFTLKDLREQGSTYTVVATGAQKGMPLGVEGQEADGVLDGIEFLRRVRDGELNSLKGRVGVVGGGDVAMDCARVAKRLGGDALVVYRRTTEEMPAHREEVLGLMEEGIPIRELSAPKAVETREGRVTGLRCAVMELGEPDASGRRRPVEVPGRDFVLELDILIAAIGQRPDLEFLKDTGVERNAKGYIVADEATGATSVEDVFAGGDAVNAGPLTLVKAEGDGKRIAFEIIRRLTGGSLAASANRCTGGLDLPAVMRKRATREKRVAVEERSVSARGNFEEVLQTLSEPAASEEASRCLACDRFCSICTSVCPNHAFLTYICEPFAVELASWTFEKGRAVAGASIPFCVEQAYQTAVLTDFCNECANCATFCPSAGKPYADKPRLYVSETEFEAQSDNAFRLIGRGASRRVVGRFRGETHVLEPRAGGYVYTAPGFRVEVDADLRPLGEPDVQLQEGRGDLLPAAILRTLLRNLAPEQLPLVDA